MILDAHLHVWDTSAVDIPWLAAAGLPPKASIPDDSGARQYILVEADADDAAKEADWLAALAQADQRVHGVVASVLLERRDAAAALDRVAALPQVVGVRRLLQDHDLFNSPGLIDGLKRLAEHRLPFDACVSAPELPALITLLEQVPELTVIIDHMGKPVVSDEQAMADWEQHLAHLAAMENVYCKLSGLPAECRDAAELEAVTAPVVGTAIALFGPKRCLLGSDQPISSDPHDWCQRVLSLLPDTDHPVVAHETASRLYARR
jgi:L-fuconolactonase